MPCLPTEPTDVEVLPRLLRQIEICLHECVEQFEPVECTLVIDLDSENVIQRGSQESEEVFTDRHEIPRIVEIGQFPRGRFGNNRTGIQDCYKGNRLVTERLYRSRAALQFV